MFHLKSWSLGAAALAAALFLGTSPASAQHRGGGGGHSGGVHVSGGHYGGGHYGGGYNHGGYYGGGYGGYYRPGVSIYLGGGGYYPRSYGGYYSSPYYYGNYAVPSTSYYYDPAPAIRYPDPSVRVIPPAENTTGLAEATVDVRVPASDALIWVDGNPTKQSGMDRSYVTPLLPTKEAHAYNFRARWMGKDGMVEETRRVEVRGGDRVMVDFTRPQE